MKVLVYTQEYEGRSAGAIHGVMSDEEANSWNNFYTSAGIIAKVDLPQELEGTDKKYLVASLVDDAWVISENTALKTSEEKAAQITSLYETMVSEVYAEMALVFGTSDANSATAYERTWTLMVQTPSDWSSAGLKAAFAVAGLAAGDALDTEQKITDYATAKLAEVKTYGIWRMQRIETFKAAKDAVLAS